MVWTLVSISFDRLLLGNAIKTNGVKFETFEPEVLIF